MLWSEEEKVINMYSEKFEKVLSYFTTIYSLKKSQL